MRFAARKGRCFDDALVGIGQALRQLQNPNCVDSVKESPLWKACAAGHASCLVTELNIPTCC